MALILNDDAAALRARLTAAEASAGQLEEWLGVTFEASPIAMGIISSLENRYVRANPALAELFDMSVDEILSSDPYTMAFRITHPDDLVVEQRLFAELAAGRRRSYQIEKRFVRRDGSHRYGLLTFSGIFAAASDPGPEALRFVVVQVIDLSAQKVLAETLQRREVELRHAQKVDGIGRLTAGIAHDFNNLLTVIMGHGGALKLALGGRAGAQGQPGEDVDAILAAAERAASLTAQLLAHGRRQAVLPRTFLLSETVESLLRLLRRILGTHITVEQSLSAQGAIFADQGQVGQVVMNLMLNARDAISDGGRIELATRDVLVEAGGAESAAAAPGEWVALTVSDTGHGMTAEVQARMFEPFFTTRSDRPGTQGTGLGLATVQRIVAELGGHIGATSSPGRGTTFTVLFPRVTQLGQGSGSSAEHEPARHAPNSQRVLVVDDEPAVRSLVANVLLGAHYLVTVARDSSEALQLLKAEPGAFQLIVTDRPLRNLAATHAQPQGASEGRPRQLIISSYHDCSPEELTAHDKLLPKPFSPGQLLWAVQNALEDPMLVGGAPATAVAASVGGRSEHY
jgi:PAS domain S-box-containing protein